MNLLYVFRINQIWKASNTTCSKYFPVCPEQCTDEAHGTCDITTGICNCVVGFGGENCASILCPDDCTDQTHGTCDLTTGICNCVDGFAGDNCASILCPDDCTDAAHGTCDLTTGICNCMDGFTGENCAGTNSANQLEPEIASFYWYDEITVYSKSTDI